MKEVNLANTSKRVFATLIDYGVFIFLAFAYTIYFGNETNDGYEVNGIGIMTLPILIFCFG